MKIVYGDLIGGASGDMFVAALLDLGLPFETLKSELKKIPSLKYRLEVGTKKLNAIRATRFRVLTGKKEPQRAWAQIRRLIEGSALDAEVKERAGEIFARLAAAEGKIHGVAAEKVHFHEVGATDSIVDTVSTAIAVHVLKIDSFHFSRIPLGRGVTRSRHGPLPLPGPATLELLKGMPVQWLDLQAETVTPTGAAIIAALGARFGAPPEMTVDQIGYGAGAKEFPDRPNVLRLVMGQDSAAWERDEMVVIETNIDDMNPEFYDYVLERLFAAGARDVSLSPVQMKKNRPGTLLRIIAEPALREKLAAIVFQETSTIGLRYYPVSRVVLKRRAARVKTRFGAVKVKIIETPDGTRKATPEYEDLKRIAARKKIPLKTLYDEVVRNK
ncbi:MAG TPA: nickel pincer cofactor biosynthesis protein LarC [Candidatus Binatia bacterium]